MDVSVGIVIPTRNRAAQVIAILDSLCESTLQPKQIVIVASGLDIVESIKKFESSLDITYLHTQLTGQVAQKSLGIRHLNSNIEWCVFSDDDLIFSKTALAEAIKATNQKSEEILGVGFALTTSSRIATMRKPLRQIAKWVNLDSNLKGKVLSSGHATSYLEATNDQFTEWLNGVSMWRVDMVKKYSIYVPEFHPASCEDLVFSYEISKKGKLLFASKAKVEFQEFAKTNAEDFEILSKSALWRLYFVLNHEELSRVKFLFSQIFRILYSIYKAKDNRLKRTWISLKWYINFIRFAVEIPQSNSKDRIKEQIRMYGWD